MAKDPIDLATSSAPHGLRDRAEAAFTRWGHVVVARHWVVLAASLAVVAACMGGLPRVYLDVSFESFLDPDDPARIAYDAFRERFGRDEMILVAVDPGESLDERGVFRADFLERLRELHEAIEARVPYVVDITSLVNARDTRGEGDTLLVEDFLDPWPEDAAAIAALRERALANPLFRNTTISAAGDVTAIVIEPELYSQVGVAEEDLGGFEEAPAEGKEAPLLSGVESAEQVRALMTLIEEREGPTFRIHAGGSPVLLQTVGGSMARDMPRFALLAIAAIALLLFLLFRRVVAVVVPILVVGLSVASTFGLMGWAGASIHAPTQILPSFLLAVGVGDAVHLLSIYFERLRHGEAAEDALPHALGHSGLAIVLTSLTTAAGLASFAGAGLEAIANVGIFAPAGVLVALFLSLTLLPAILSIAPMRPPAAAGAAIEPNAFDRLLGGFGRFATRRPWVVVGATFAIAAVSAVGIARIGLSHNPLAWMSPASRVVGDMNFLDERLGGGISFEVLLETEPRGAREPEVLTALDAFGRSLEEEARDGRIAGQTISLADVVKEIHRALNADDPEAYVVPQDRLLVAQELLLFENSGSDDLEDLTDSQYEVARLTVRMPWDDAIHYATFIEGVVAEVDERLDRFGDASVTGALALIVRAMHALVESLATSYAIAFAVITPLMVLLLGNLRTGLVAMIPNLLPIAMTLGVMGAFGFPLDAFSLMAGGIALGLAVDDTIHFMHNYRRYRRRGLPLEGAVDATLQTAGRAMLVTTIALSTGFLAFVMSSMVNLQDFGLLVAFAIACAFFADVLLAPALLAIFDRGEVAADATR